MAQQLLVADEAMAEAQAAAAAMQAEPATAPVDEVRRQLRVDAADFDFRQAVRSEQEVVYWLAAHPGQQAALLSLAQGARTAGLVDVVAGLRSLWRSAGVTHPAALRPHEDHSFADAAPVATLLADYRAAAQATGIDWTYLAAINYIESDFGRSTGPSSAGALGPMQFLPSTWQQFGEGGNIMSPHDSIMAAARFLRWAGAPRDYMAAVYAYNHDRDYVAAVQDLAAAMDQDQLWLNRLYYWNTFG
jgi:membrane-bound lytic murein transglycosylase B